ncbi:MAG: hypothetical protein FWH28_01450 [Clostridiales bacterium]|nr:hypothetical protein [Clostridiales bacterium]
MIATSKARLRICWLLACILIFSILPIGPAYALHPDLGAWANAANFGGVAVPDDAEELVLSGIANSGQSFIERVFWKSDAPGSQTGTIYMYFSTHPQQSPDGGSIGGGPLQTSPAPYLYQNTRTNVFASSQNNSSVFAGKNLLRTSGNDRSLFLLIFTNVTLDPVTNIEISVTGDGHSIGSQEINVDFLFAYAVEYYYDNTVTGTLFASAYGIGVLGDPILYSLDGNSFADFDPGYNENGVKASGSDTITNTPGDNIVRIVFQKRNDIPFLVEYYYDDTSDAPFATTSGTGTFDSLIPYTLDGSTLAGFNPGYDPSSGIRVAGPDDDRITAIEEENVIQVVFARRSDIPYTIEYYYDDTSGTPFATDDGSGTFGAAIPYTLNGSTLVGFHPGYNPAGALASGPATITAEAADNVAMVVFEKRDDISYTVEYYYDDTSGTPFATGSGSGTFEDLIPYTLDGSTLAGFNPGYDPAGTRASGPVDDEITATAADNVVVVVFGKRDDISYTVEYYYDDTSGAPFATVSDEGTFDNLIPYTLNGGDLTGFSSEYLPAGTKASGPDRITAVVADNLVQVVFTRLGDLEYAIAYYQDSFANAPIATDTYPNQTAGSTVTITDGQRLKYLPSGYVFDSTEPASGQITITQIPEDNVIRVLYLPETGGTLAVKKYLLDAYGNKITDERDFLFSLELTDNTGDTEVISVQTLRNNETVYFDVEAPDNANEENLILRELYLEESDAYELVEILPIYWGRDGIGRTSVVNKVIGETVFERPDAARVVKYIVYRGDLYESVEVDGAPFEITLTPQNDPADDITGTIIINVEELLFSIEEFVGHSGQTEMPIDFSVVAVLSGEGYEAETEIFHDAVYTETGLQLDTVYNLKIQLRFDDEDREPVTLYETDVEFVEGGYQTFMVEYVYSPPFLPGPPLPGPPLPGGPGVGPDGDPDGGLIDDGSFGGLPGSVPDTGLEGAGGDSEPSLTPSGEMDDEPSLTPSGEADDEPSLKPSGEVDDEPSLTPSGEADDEPSLMPSGEADDEPALMPFSEADDEPSLMPFGEAEVEPSLMPFGEPDSEAAADSGSGEEALENGSEDIGPVIEVRSLTIVRQIFTEMFRDLDELLQYITANGSFEESEDGEIPVRPEIESFRGTVYANDVNGLEFLDLVTGIEYLLEELTDDLTEYAFYGMKLGNNGLSMADIYHVNGLRIAVAQGEENLHAVVVVFNALAQRYTLTVNYYANGVLVSDLVTVEEDAYLSGQAYGPIEYPATITVDGRVYQFSTSSDNLSGTFTDSDIVVNLYYTRSSPEEPPEEPPPPPPGNCNGTVTPPPTITIPDTTPPQSDVVPGTPEPLPIEIEDEPPPQGNLPATSVRGGRRLGMPFLLAGAAGMFFLRKRRKGKA